MIHSQESQCPEREIDCKYCELEVRAGDYDTHIETCGSRTDYCDRCNVRVMLKDMEEHKLTKCSDLKAEDELHPEPTLENLPPAYMDGFAGDGFSAAASQGVLIGDGAGGGAFGGIRILGGFGVAPQFLGDGTILFGAGSQHQDGQRREENIQVLYMIYLCSTVYPCLSESCVQKICSCCVQYTVFPVILDIC